MQWLKERLRGAGYTEVDTVFTPPWITQMRSRLNRGDTVFGYRGFAGMSGFEVGDILALQNGWKMPYAVNLTCLTGSFASGTSRSEAWIRAGIPPDVPTGGIASVGTATGGTHTRYNNCITYGIWYGVFGEGLHRFGESLTRGKYELFVNYGVTDQVHARIFSHWNNLMGDAAGELWTGVPQPLDVAHPGHIAAGANALTVAVGSGGAPAAGAYVCLWKDGEVHAGGATGADGTLTLTLPPLSAGELKLTVTRHDARPYTASLPTGVVEEVSLAADDLVVDDDAQGTSAGNADGIVNPGEALELPVRARNFGGNAASGVAGQLSTLDPYVTVVDAAEAFGNIAAGDSAWCADDFDLVIDGGAPDGHVVVLDVELSAGEGSWRSRLEIPVAAAALVPEATTLYGCGERLDPGEAGELSVRLRNAGATTAESLRATLQSLSPWVVVTDAAGEYGSLGVGATGENTADRFGLEVSAECFRGHIAAFRLVCEFSGAARDTVELALPVGTVSSTDPTGPDRYGYYAFDNTDAAYADAPAYAWVEIDPRYGGGGTAVGLTDFGDAQDDSRTVELPFPFTYYGITHHEATICSNGWLAMGATPLVNYQNWNIPGVGAPANLIAPMWDDLYQYGGDQVYHWHDAAGGRYVVQWSRVRNAVGGATETFQAILYDTRVHPTETGDGAILFQYQTFVNSDGEIHYSTNGIQNAAADDGLMYGYFNYYNAGAAPIGAGRAIRFLARSGSARGLLSGFVRNGSHGGAPLAGAEVRVLEAGIAFTSAGDGTYGGSVPPGVYTLVAAHPSFAPDTARAVPIDPGGLTTRDFTLADVAGPTFLGTTELPSTSDTQGPYVVSTRVRDDSPITEAVLRYRAGAGEWATVPLQPAGGDSSAASIPGQPLGTPVFYYVEARDAAGNRATDPPAAPEDAYWFWVHEPQFADDMEHGETGWTHAAATGGYADQWHRSSQRNHTPGGQWSWKCGSRTGGGYADLGDGALVTEAFAVDGVATLRFWHWMDSELFWHGTEYAFDGGRLEISVDGGSWNPIAPEGGYPYRLLDWPEGQSPFPPGIWLYSGQHDWQRAEFVLPVISGTARVRFRFGTDNFELNPHEGWYIDDVEIVLPGPEPSAARELELHPEAVALRGPVPNPLGSGAGGALLRFELPQPSFVRLEIFDVAGRRVRSLLAEPRAAGMHRVTWDGRLDHGARAPGGVYRCVLEAMGRRQSRPLVVVR
jgi:hypothetical protein